MKRDYRIIAIESLINDKLDIELDSYIDLNENHSEDHEVKRNDYSVNFIVDYELSGSIMAANHYAPAESDYKIAYTEVSELNVTDRLGDEIELTEEEKTQIIESFNFTA